MIMLFGCRDISLGKGENVFTKQYILYNIIYKYRIKKRELDHNK